MHMLLMEHLYYILCWLMMCVKHWFLCVPLEHMNAGKRDRFWTFEIHLFILIYIMAWLARIVQSSFIKRFRTSRWLILVALNMHFLLEENSEQWTLRFKFLLFNCFSNPSTMPSTNNAEAIDFHRFPFKILSWFVMKFTSAHQ